MSNRRRIVVNTLAALCLGLLGGAAFAPSASAAPTCTPGSGAHLAGKHLDAAALAAAGSLQCADLTGADLSGLSLTQANLSGILAPHAKFVNASLDQADLSGADLTGADLHRADLTQATLTGANLTGADLAHARLDQAEAGDVTLSGADLTDASVIQTHLSGSRLDGAKVGGADFTQADLDGTKFDNVKGLTDWSTYVLLAAAAVFVIVGALVVTRVVKRTARIAPAPQPFAAPVASGSYWSQPGVGANPAFAPAPAAAPFGAFNPINGPTHHSRARGISIGLLAALVIAVATHLFLGGMIGTFSYAFDTLATKVCTAPQCAVGVGSGTFGLIGGVFLAIGGFALLAKA